ncbi:SusC/RagA family TonB-linked outer membrane protein [Sphingobacterium spiritivorum]|uniref:TonB-linked outer membrane protein, SusC/RagA family n=1 Tax=Sphingobacterium spiritivorum ATCC 33861 TaxID=525373 RepID=D7VI58_SPHSI|nr:TonB-dependent receptor [Sphingobacterium spiritivorum]EFK59760.1 TonB-linked outer membrane protein, SusC/RagA family [Sphingobacterium spiritivorum ATCC 33861]QQT37594.1 TonB-dependent receptor [Sphingobacterium spiritivorum]WQD34392.1 TonB-dependent receptor [Sphingobacterium spiritivorum]SUI97333.1 TonB-linked outer membrane protein, SusC/RagA family [Sphingobacterium spiritivorum]
MKRKLLVSLWLLIGTVCMSAAFAQTKSELDITGTVKDELNNPLDGVTVVNTASKKTVATDPSGQFNILAARGDTIVVRYIGYEDYRTVINTTINLNVTLKAINNSINEVVVVGYGQQKKISLVGAQSTVKVEDLKVPIANLSAALAGRISGLIGVQRTGLPGSDGADLWIRGISTFNQSGNNASPLVVVDGIQGRDINSFDPEDISSFTILKDASATAVYGVAGANGVILITTKRGMSGKPVLMFNYNQGLTSFTKRPELTDGVTYMKLRNEARIATGLEKEYSNNYINNTILGTDPYLYPNVNWMDELFRSVSTNRRANFSARGGSEFANYYVSGAYYDEESLLRTDALQSYDATTRFKRYNFTSNVSMNWTSTTKFELGMQGYVANINYPGVNPQDAFSNVMQTNPVLYPVMYPGNLVPGVSSAGAQPNPYALVTQTGFQNIFSNQIMTNARLTQDLKFWVPGLTFSALYSFDIWNSHTINRVRNRSTYLINRLFPYDENGNPILNIISQGTDDLAFSKSNDANRQFYTEASLNYNTTIAEDHTISAMLLFNQREKTFAFANSVTSSLPFRSQGLAGRLTYSFADKYFVEGNFGYNGSENFAPDMKFGFFPSFGVGWVVSNEKFYEPVKDVFDFLKLRYSNGIVGDGGALDINSGVRRFGYLTLVNTEAGGYTFGNGSNNVGYGGTAITDYGTNVQWAESHKQNLGVEIKTLKSKLSLTVDFFKERRSGVFLQRGALPGYVGLNSSPWGNLGILDNKGIDATLELAPIAIGKAYLDMRATFTHNKDKVIENDQPKQPFDYMERRGVNYLSRFGYVADGLFQSQKEIAEHADQSALGAQRVGDIRYKDLNGDGIINANDVTRIGNGDVPNTIYGFGFNVTYKQFYVGAFFQGISGADRQIAGDGIIPFNNSTGAERSNLFAVAEDRWTEENPDPNAFYPRLAYGNAANKNNAVSSTWWVKDIDFLRLKTIDLGYNFKKGTFQSIGMKNARIYIQGVNLLYWSKFKLWDPELNTSNGTRYPNVRTVTLGVQASF